jgi:hypothetical protein
MRTSPEHGAAPAPWQANPHDTRTSILKAFTDMFRHSVNAFFIPACHDRMTDIRRIRQ